MNIELNESQLTVLWIRNRTNSIEHAPITDYNEILSYVAPKRAALNINEEELFHIRLYLSLFIIVSFMCITLLYIMTNWNLFLYAINKLIGVDNENAVATTESITEFLKEKQNKKLQKQMRSSNETHETEKFSIMPKSNSELNIESHLNSDLSSSQKAFSENDKSSGSYSASSSYSHSRNSSQRSSFYSTGSDISQK